MNRVLWTSSIAAGDIGDSTTTGVIDIDCSGNTNLQGDVVSSGAIQITTTSSGTLRFDTKQTFVLLTF